MPLAKTVGIRGISQLRIRDFSGRCHGNKLGPLPLLSSLQPRRHAVLSRDLEASPNTSHTNYIRFSYCLALDHHNIMYLTRQLQMGKISALLGNLACLSGGRDSY